MPIVQDDSSLLLQNKALELVKEDIQSTASKRTDLDKKIRKRRALFNSELPARQYSGRSNVRVPFPYVWAQSMIPRYMGSIFNGTEVLDAYCRSGNDFQGALGVRRLLNFQLLFEMDFFTKALQYHTVLTREGVGIQKLRWDPELQTGELHQIRSNDFAMDLRAADIRSATWVAHRIGKTKEELEAGVQVGKYDGVAVERLLMAQKPSTGGEKDGAGKDLPLPEMRATYKLWEWMGVADVGPDVKDDGSGNMITVAEGVRPVIMLVDEDFRFQLGVRTNPYGRDWPIVATSDVPDPWFLMDGKSELDTMESLYEAVSDVWNQRLDNVTLDINGFWTYKTNTGIKASRLVSTPWGAMGVNDHDDIKRWETKNVTQNAYQETSALLEALKMSSGLTDMERGESKKGERTAEETVRVGENASQRPGMKVQISQYLYLKRLGELLLYCDQSFMDKAKAIMVMGDEQSSNYVVSPEGIAGSYAIMPRGFALAGNKMARVGNLNNTLNLLNAAADPKYIPVKDLIVKEILSLNDVRIPTELAYIFQPQPQPMIPGMPGPGLGNIALPPAPGAGPQRSMTGPQGVPGVSNVPGQPPPGPSTPVAPGR